MRWLQISVVVLLSVAAGVQKLMVFKDFVLLNGRKEDLMNGYIEIKFTAGQLAGQLGYQQVVDGNVVEIHKLDGTPAAPHEFSEYAVAAGGKMVVPSFDPDVIVDNEMPNHQKVANGMQPKLIDGLPRKQTQKEI